VSLRLTPEELAECEIARPSEVEAWERLRLVAAGARALALATSDPTAKVELERLAKLAEEGGR